MPVWDKKDNEGIDTVLVRGDFHKLKLAGAQEVASAIKAYDCVYGMKFGWGIGPASQEESEYPLITKVKLGKGEVWYLEANIFSDYNENANWTQISWYRGLLEKLLPTPSLRIISDNGTVEGVLHESKESSWIFILNHGGEQFSNNPGNQQKWARTFEPLPAFPIKIEIAVRNKKPKNVSCMGKKIEYSQKNGKLTIEIKADTIWKALKINWQKG